MRTTCRVAYEHATPLPDWTVDDVRMPPAYVERFLAEYTDPGDVVLDPFAGFGTTLRVATEMGRDAYGVEYEERRVEYVEDQGNCGTVVRGDAREPDAVEGLDLPPVDCCLTSPPWMVEGMAADPLRNYEGPGDYGSYLDGIREAFAQVDDVLAADGTVLVDAANVKFEGEVTTLAWDLADAVGDVLHFDGEVVVEWETDGDASSSVGTFGTGYDHNYCLVFSAVRSV